MEKLMFTLKMSIFVLLGSVTGMYLTPNNLMAVDDWKNTYCYSWEQECSDVSLAWKCWETDDGCDHSACSSGDDPIEN